MFKYLAKLELKKGIFYHLFTLLFSFFWHLFFLIMMYAYVNIALFEERWNKKLVINVFYFSENRTAAESFYKELNEKLSFYIRKAELIDPNSLFSEVKDELSKEIFEIFSEEEIKKNFPYLIKIYPKTLDDHFKLYSQLDFLKKLNPNLEIEIPKLVKFLKSSLVLKSGLLVIICSWIILFIVFVLFINLFLNEISKDSLRTLFLLGGTLRSLSLVRVFFLCSFQFLGFLIAFLVFIITCENLTYFLGTLPFSHFFNLHNLYLFLIYILLSCFLLPWIFIFISYKEYEI